MLSVSYITLCRLSERLVGTTMIQISLQRCMLLSLLLAMLVSIAGGIEVRVKSYHLSQSKLVCDVRNCMAKFDLSHTVYFIVQNDVPDAVDAVTRHGELPSTVHILFCVG
jgi:hypothetical protein